MRFDAAFSARSALSRRDGLESKTINLLFLNFIILRCFLSFVFIFLGLEELRKEAQWVQDCFSSFLVWIKFWYRT